MMSPSVVLMRCCNNNNNNSYLRTEIGKLAQHWCWLMTTAQMLHSSAQVVYNIWLTRKYNFRSSFVGECIQLTLSSPRDPITRH